MRKILLSGTIPGKMLIDRPIIIHLHGEHDGYVAICPEIFAVTVACTKNEALKYMRQELASTLRWLNKEVINPELSEILREETIQQLTYLQKHITPFGTERAKKHERKIPG